MGFIDTDQLKKLAEPFLKSGYGNYLLDKYDNYSATPGRLSLDFQISFQSADSNLLNPFAI